MGATAHRSGRLRLELLAALGDRIREIEDPRELAYAAAELLGRHLEVSRAGYGTIDLEDESISIDRDWNAPGIKSLAGTLKFRDYGSYIDDLKRGEIVILEDAETDPRTHDRAEALKALSARSLINMPVSEHGKVVALLYLNNAAPRRWSDDEITLIFEVAERTRTAIERLRAERALRETTERLAFLDRLGKEIALAKDADAVMATTTKRLGEHLGVSICAYADMAADQDHFTIRGDWSAPGSPSIVGYYSLADFGKLAVSNLSANRPLIINNNLTEIDAAEAKTFQDIGITATICMPLVKQGRLAALMAIHDKEPRVWSERELALLTEVTERSWAHIERVRSEEAARTSEERLRLATDAAAIGIWDYDPVTDTLRWDDRCKALFGLPPEASVSYEHTFLPGLHPDDRSRADNAVRQALKSGGSSRYDIEYRTIGLHDGKERWIAATGDALFENGWRSIRFRDVMSITVPTGHKCHCCDRRSRIGRRDYCPDGDRRRGRTHGSAVRRIFLQSRGRKRRQLHTLHAIWRSAIGVRELSDAPQHCSLRAYVPRYRRGSFRRHPAGSAIWQEFAKEGDARRSPAGAVLSGGTGHLPIGRGVRRALFWAFRRRRLRCGA